jgi:hypothetical protein
MVNNSNNSNTLKEEYCQGNNRPEWCTKTSNSNTSKNEINNLLEQQKQRNKKVVNQVGNAEKQFRNATNSLASVSRPETPKMKELYERLAAHKGNLIKAEADLEQAMASKAAVISGQSAASEPAVPAAGGARKSRKHKRTRKRMRKHTRKHKVMKSKMTKSKSKKEIKKKEKKTKGH